MFTPEGWALLFVAGVTLSVWRMRARMIFEISEIMLAED
jgi:hypothetical protein